MDYLLKTFWKLLGYDDESSGCATPRKFVAFGNVLLDYTAQLSDTKILVANNIELNTKGELDAEKLSKITAEVCDSIKSEVNPGGAALNTIRILKQLGTCGLFFGAVGEDEQAEKLKDILKSRGIEARFQTVPGSSTGKCICLIYEDTTTLYANIGASAKFSIDFLKRLEHDDSVPFLRPIERKQILYIEAFFIPQRFEVCKYIVTNYIRDRRRLAVNLSAAYIVEQNYEEVLYLAKNAYFLFGNKNEFDALIDGMGCGSVEQMATSLFQSDVPRVIVITKGGSGVQVISNVIDESSTAGHVTYENYNVPKVENLVDTTGAGDAFVAGFFHAWLQKRSLCECIQTATDVAAKVCTQIGCNFP